MPDDLTFIGKNIRFLRRSKNLTLLQLADRIGIREGPLGRIERGANLPSATVIYNLAKEFKVSADALFSEHMAPVREAGGEDTFFVSLDPCAAPPTGSLINDCHDLMDAFHTLEDICGVQKHAFLPLSLPFEPDYPGMEHLAGRIRTYLSIGDAVIFDYFELFENHGLRVILFPFQKAGADTDSISFYEPAFHNAFFFLNSRNNPEKQLFSLAKELGSILILNQMRLSSMSLFPETSGDDSFRPVTPDRAAGRFAATFLMPEQTVRSTVSQLGIQPDRWSFDLLLRIKHRFGVSTESFLYRLDELGLISTGLKTQFESQIKKIYTRTHYQEPDSTRRCLTPNGRFFDLLLTATTKVEDYEEIKKIEKMIHKKRTIQI